MSKSTDDQDVSVTFPSSFQGVTLWLGDGAPCTVEDNHTESAVRDWVYMPLQRKVMAARLRQIADMLDNPAADLRDKMAPISAADPR